MAEDAPTREELRTDLKNRIARLDERIEELEELQQEREVLATALAGLEGRSGPDIARRKGGRRGTALEVQRRRDMVVALLEGNPDLSINEVAEEVGVGYQTAANDIRLLKANGSLPE